MSVNWSDYVSCSGRAHHFVQVNGWRTLLILLYCVRDKGAIADLWLVIVGAFRTAVSFSGQLGTNYLECDCLVPKTGLEF